MHLVYLVVFLPLAGFLVASLLSLTKFIGEGESGKEKLVGFFSTLMIAIPFGIVATLFASFGGEAQIVALYEWIGAGSLSAKIAYRIDSLSLVMAMIVTGVGSLIHLYSIGYMHGDEGFARFFAYLNLFIFAMLNLILADNMLLMFLGWEGVGLCSYLLIGFWFDRKFEGVGIETTTDAANKAFIMNRIGDFAMLAAMFLIFQKVSSLDYEAMFSQKAAFDSTHLFWIATLVFIGCSGKSAQIPLYTWLPDAMAGPTPVSALIHAATMVTSGVYLIARLSPLLTMSPEAMSLIAVIGAATAFIAATIGVAQNDIKKVLAYSTVSQLGYMFLALGVGAFGSAIFHVATHAFFKACLFLGAGSVIHALHEEQDIRKMGGLAKAMPQTNLTFLVATLALAGFPLTAGFFSKDDILAKTFESQNYALWAIGLLTAFITAFYAMRLYALAFLGEARWDSNEKPHESPALMTIPLWILGALSLFGGAMGLPAVIQERNWIQSFLATSVVGAETHPLSHSTEWMLLGVSSLVAILGLGVSLGIYGKKKAEGEPQGVFALLHRKYYVDEIYDALVSKPFQWLCAKVLAPFDARALDGLVNGIGGSILGLGAAMRRWQTGVAQNYALVITIGLILLVGYIALS
ncbi:MAG: NADH-quinone oxidoreductase subunit L [Chloroherpetonaceae bacterium]|nr:NADH-quinone oxidoreductase subunit L [Chloroherpetonaceae bacterium]MDW8437012.1 NADH-quinone oxidoreductase subunit L [Chloroherpetonaceae bacterium]